MSIFVLVGINLSFLCAKFFVGSFLKNLRSNEIRKKRLNKGFEMVIGI